ncbi:MAG TPA: DinB family protein [Thermoplasmata archaeon]|nr:DinB family protein [Thermoplasmata archaeon]
MPAGSDRVEDARRLHAYNVQVLGRYERSVARRPWSEATADVGIGHRSLKDTLVHILNVHEAWLVAIAQDRWEVFDAEDRQPENVASWAMYRSYRDRVWAGIGPLLGELTDRRLGSRVRAPWMPGRYTLSDAFRQVSFEQAHHLGEVIGVYWQRDRAPPTMTWIENLPRLRPKARAGRHRH